MYLTAPDLKDLSSKAETPLEDSWTWKAAELPWIYGQSIHSLVKTQNVYIFAEIIKTPS